MKIGFSGTQEGMTEAQKKELQTYLFLQAIFAHGDEFHHGDCIGADAEADEIARKLELTIVIHPPENPSKRAFKAQSGDTVWEPRPYLERNQDIVDETEILIAAPKSPIEELRSGTWATIRYARKLGRKVIILDR